MYSSFIIPFPVERVDNVTQTLRLLAHYHKDVLKNSEVLLMCQNRTGFIETEFLETNPHNLKLPCMQKGKLLNEAVKVAKSDILVFLDSDRVLPFGYFKEVIDNLKKRTAVTTKNMHRLSRPVSDAEIITDNFEFEPEHRSVENKILMRNFFSGNIVMYKEDYLQAGGMDEFYIGYGFEDHDMTNVLFNQGIQQVWREEVELHLYHERLTYGEGNQKRMFLNNGVRYCKKWQIPIPGKLQVELDQYTKVML